MIITRVMMRFAFDLPCMCPAPLIRLPQLELDGREHRDDNHEHNAHCVAVAVAVELERGVIDIVHYRIRAVRRPAGGEQLDKRKALERIDGSNDEYVERGGHDLCPLDLPEHLTAVRTVDLRRLDERMVDIAECRDVEHDRLTDRGREEDEDDAPERKARVAQPVYVLVDDAGALEKIVENAVAVVVHPLPHDRYRDGAGDDGQIEDAAESRGQRGLHIIYRGGDPERKRAHRRHGDNDDDDGVLQRAEEELIMEKLLIIIQPDKDVHGILAHIGVKQAGVYAHEHGIEHEGDEEEQAWQQKQIARYRLPPHERAAHAVVGLEHRVDPPLRIM